MRAAFFLFYPGREKMKSERYECHGHLLMDGADFKQARKKHQPEPDERIIRRELTALSEAGVVYFRDGGDADSVCVRAREIAPEYGIDYVSPIYAIHRKGRYGGIVGRGFTDLKEYRELVQTVRTSNGDFIKLIVSGIVTFKQYGELSCPSLEEKEITEMVHIAKNEGFSVMVHVNGPAALQAVIKAGADSIEHGVFMDEETLDLLAGSDTVWVPTIAAIEAFVGRKEFNEEAAAVTFQRHKEAVAMAAEKGVRIASGSDSGAVGVPHGRGTIREYELLKEAGLSEKQILDGNLCLRKIFRR